MVLLGLGIAGYTYGALLGAFLLGLAVPRANGRDAIAAFLVTLVVMTAVVRSYTLAFTWYVPLGVMVSLAVGGLLSLLHPARTRPISREHADAAACDWFVGLMTGTVLDGNIDIACCAPTARPSPSSARGRWRDTATRPAPAGRSAGAGAGLAVRGAGAGRCSATAEDALTRAQSAAVTAFLAAGIAPAEVAAIGFHGQTVLHRAPRPAAAATHGSSATAR